METKDIIYELRTKKGLSQEELAEKIFVAESDSKGGTYSGVQDGLKKSTTLHHRSTDKSIWKSKVVLYFQKTALVYFYIPKKRVFA